MLSWKGVEHTLISTEMARQSICNALSTVMVVSVNIQMAM